MLCLFLKDVKSFLEGLKSFSPPLLFHKKDVSGVCLMSGYRLYLFILFIQSVCVMYYIALCSMLHDFMQRVT